MNGYELSRRLFDFAFENKECGVYHIAIYMWIVELNNRLGWKEEFGLPSHDTCDGLSIGNKNTYLSALKDLEKWGFIKIIKESRNQFSATIVSICRVKSDTATDTARHTALDTALIRQGTQHGYAIDTIDKQENHETMKPGNHETNIISIEKTTEIQTIKDTTYTDSINSLKANAIRLDNGEKLEIPDYAQNYAQEWFKFTAYWTERDKKGRIRAEMQKTFEIKRRFGTWMQNKGIKTTINPITRIGSL